MKILNLTLHANWIELNWIIIQFNWIQIEWMIFKFNRKKRKENWWKSCWKFTCEYCVGKKTLKKTQIQKYAIPCLFTWQWAKQIRVWNHPSDDNNLWNLKLSHLNQFRWIIITKNWFLKCVLFFDSMLNVNIQNIMIRNPTFSILVVHITYTLLDYHWTKLGGTHF
jgi:hypothetical protein